MPFSVRVGCLAVGTLTFWLLAGAFGGFAKYGSGPIAESAETIQRAIDKGQHVTFQYTKRKRRLSERRTIKPSELTYVIAGQQNSLCVVGYCLDRKAMRTFAIGRMASIRIVDA